MRWSLDNLSKMLFKLSTQNINYYDFEVVKLQQFSIGRLPITTKKLKFYHRKNIINMYFEKLANVEGENFWRSCSFLGMCNVYRRFAPNFARVVAPRNKRLGMGEPTRFKLNDKERRTIDNLKQKIISPHYSFAGSRQTVSDWSCHMRQTSRQCSTVGTSNRVSSSGIL